METEGSDSMNLQKAALIPAYRPDAELLGIVSELAEKNFAIVLVDDGSGIEFRELFRKAAGYAELLRHPVNRGKGAALKTGLSYMQTHYPDALIITMDADGQHTVADAEKILAQAERFPDALILGSRRMNKSAPLRSRFGNALTRCVFHMTSGVSVYDTQTGLRGFSARLLPLLLSIDGERYEYEMNVLMQCAKQNIPMYEIPIETIYQENNAASHFRAVRDSIRIYSEILKFSASSIIGFAVDYLFYSLLTILTGNPTVSNILARIVSASVNFTLNRKLVFRSRGNLLMAAVRYCILASVILLGNTLVLHLLSETLGMNQYLAKLLTEILFFLLSFTVQRWIIFKKERDLQQ